MEPNQSIQNTNAEVIIVWSGYLTVPFIKEWYEQSKHWENVNGKKIKLNLNGIERIDSAGIQLLIYLKTQTLKKHQSLELTNHSLAVLKSFDLLGLVSFFGDRIKVKKEHSHEVEFRYGTRKVS
ncbi:STAS domain-containing protein [Leptospira jelokensis]|uniref:STAS domain-containing protein n=1 Tax=Leptospira jelokensis TaxID=2484931 RepID=A0A4Z1AAE9_9LEPT|nr:STAS domain-containing protein [Leptospira jelokensis]TGL74146.1 STAS domain-containing protein [Leptospira jelokensis]